MNIQLLRSTPDAKEVALTAIRTCYSPNKPSQIVELEGEKYFGREATDGKGGNEADRLIRHIVTSGHTSTLEHIHFVFAVEGVSRSLLAQLTRHRQLSFSVQSQRYVKLESNSRSGGAEFVTPPSWEKHADEIGNVRELFQEMYDDLRKLGIPAEDARYILPNATACNAVVSGNLRAWLEFYTKRNATTHAQWEIQDFAEQIKEEICTAEDWLTPFFTKGGN